MDDRRAHSPTSPSDPGKPVRGGRPAAEEPAHPDGASSDGVDLSSLSVAGITRRRVGFACAAVVAAWIVIVFARQASEGAAAAARADQITRDNAALSAEVAALEHERQLIERPAYIEQQARAFRMGNPKEIPFTLDPSVPSPAPDAPGSASTRVGADEERTTPFESWLSLLFGPAD